ncbi:tyrosine-type recombinase/integrase [Shewanella sp.]|uniref:tyrosine-type recombinase/integrase n=1 Tax=Shewanella sp. TaxID=50422 RepID=UPI004047A709
MPTYRKLPSGKINAMVRLSGFPTKSRTFDDRNLAEQWANSYEREIKSDYQIQLTSNISDVSKKYLESVMVGRGGYESIYYRLKNLGARCAKPLGNITTQDLSALRNARLKEVSPSTVRLELQLLSRLLNFARMELGIANLNPFEDFKLPPANAPRSAILTQIQYQSLLADIAPKVKPILILAWETSMRRSEILSIKRSSIDWSSCTLNLQETKNGYSRDVPLNSRALQALREQLPLTDSDALFNLKPHSVSKAFKRSCERLKYTGICFHSLRHTAITRYANRGINTLQLQVISGHRDIKMLARYTHLKAADVAKLMD